MCAFGSANHIEMCIFSEANSIEKCEDALSTCEKNEGYRVKKAYVLSNAREITTNCKVTYIPSYDLIFLGAAGETQQ